MRNPGGGPCLTPEPRPPGTPESYFVRKLHQVPPFASVGLPGTPEGTIVHYADYIANDFASILMGVEPVHSAMRMVPKDPSYGSAAG